ncbi:MAG: MFS transporter [Phycisphaerae bacterium]|nr:MFS transporter [Phycisphaerae bacterium]
MLRSLRHRNFRLYFGGQFISLVGTFLTQTATVWLVFRLTHSAWWLGLVGFVGQLPLFLLSPLAGVWVDRLNRRKLLVITQTLAMLQSFALAVLALTHIITRNEILILALMQGLINALDLPARQSFIVEMVDGPQDLANAIALNSTLVQTTRLMGPAAAGVLIHLVGEGACFLIDGISYIAVIAALLAMYLTPRPPRAPRSVRAEMIEGFHYVWKFTPMRALLLLLATVSLAGTPTISVLMPIFAAHFGGVTQGDFFLGLLGSASGVGALVASVYLASRKTVVGLGRVIAISAGTFGLAMIAFGLSVHLWIAMICIAFGGWGMVMTFASGNTVLQTLAEEDKRGRVMSFFTMAFIGMTPFGNLIAGELASVFSHGAIDPVNGAATTLFINGGVCLAGALVFASMLQQLRKLVWPVYISKGILPEVAEGLNVEMQVTVNQR